MTDFILRAGEAAGNAGTGTGMSSDEMMGTTYGSLMSIGLLVLMFVVFYFILIRPQRKQGRSKQAVSRRQSRYHRRTCRICSKHQG